MAANTNPIFALAPVVSGTSVVNADGTAEQTVFTAGAEGAIVERVSVAATSSVAEEFNVIINDGATSFLVGTVDVPINSGNSGTIAAVSLLNTTDMPWIRTDGSIVLGASDTLRVAATTAVTDGKVDFLAMGGNF